MIVKSKNEELVNVKGKIDAMEEYIFRAQKMSKEWADAIAISENGCPVRLTDDLCAAYTDPFGYTCKEDISEYAFSQLCTKVGVPASYVQKCFTAGKSDLAIQNFHEWSQDITGDQSMLVRNYGGIVRAVLTSRYNVFDSASVMECVYKALNAPAHKNRYTLNQIFLSEDKLHIRFVDFNTSVKAGSQSLTPGFTVSSSDVGSGSLNIKYFLYRFACKNGIVIVKNGGILFRQTHLAEFDKVGVSLFSEALKNIDTLNKYSQQQLKLAYEKVLSENEMKLYLAKAQKELHLGKGKAVEYLNDLLLNTYPDGNLLSFIHSITENAQKYSLETRIDHEVWAGNLLTAA